MVERKQKAPASPRQQEIDRLRKTPRDKRSAEQIHRLAALVTEEKRERFSRVFPRRLENLKRAVRNTVRLGNPVTYQYTDEEAAQLVAAVKRYAAEIERAFRGAPQEKGMYDL